MNSVGSRDFPVVPWQGVRHGGVLPAADLSALIWAAFLSGAVPTHPEDQPKAHRFTVKFNYDFTAMHACPVNNAARRKLSHSIWTKKSGWSL
jgi:hypothetical protein